MRSVLPLCLCGGLTFLALMPAHAAGRTLLLELWLDGKNLDQIVPVTLTDGHLFLAASDLAALKLTVPMPAPDKDGRTDLSAIAGLQANVDEADQKLNLSLPTHALPQQLYDLAQDQRETPQMTQDATGAMLHYDFSATADNAAVLGNHIAGGANLALDVFTPDALIHATGFFQRPGRAMAYGAARYLRGVRQSANAHPSQPGRCDIQHARICPRRAVRRRGICA